jgi:lysophospholipase L1-like esterase
MFVARLTVCCAVSALLLAGCSQTPTSPSTASAPIIIGEIPQASAPVPPRLSVDPPKALGATRFVAFGDSITWGAYSSWDPRFLFAAANGGYVERLQAGLNSYHQPQQFTVFNEGVGGEWASASQTLARFRSVLTNRRPQVVLLLEGINDLNSGVDIPTVVSGLSQLVTAATSAGIPVLVATMFQTYEVADPDPTKPLRLNAATLVPEFNRQVRAMVSARLNVHLVDLEPVMGERRFVGNDGLHLTDQGFEVMASTFLAAIEKAFPVRGSFQ